MIPSTQMDHLRDALQSVLEAGVQREDILTLMIDTLHQSQTPEPPTPPSQTEEPNELPMFTELPPGLIDLGSASRKYDFNRYTAYGWVMRKKIRCFGRLRAPAKGGGYLVVNEQELYDYLQRPPDKGGRPRKKL